MVSLPGTLQRSLRVWRRNALVWRRSATRSLLGCFADPLLYLLALGYGLGHFIEDVGGNRYIIFLSSGIVATSAMNTATFECLYLAYTRMQVQKTWDGILATPISLSEIVIGEILWAGSKSVVSATAILSVTALFGFVSSWTALWIIPLAFFAGCCFGSMALAMTSLSYSYDFFMYYMTLVITPMILLSGVFFPVEALPDSIRTATAFFPLQHLVSLIRPAMLGQSVSEQWWLNLTVPAIFLFSSFTFATNRFKKRILN